MQRHFPWKICQQCFFAIIFSLLFIASALAQTITLSASPTGSEVAEHLGAAFTEVYPQYQFKQLPAGGNGSIRALKDGALDIAIVSQPLSSYEIAVLGGASIKIASSPYVFASHRKAETMQLTRKILADIYAGKLENWPSGQRIRLILSQGRSDNAFLKNISQEMDSALEIALGRPGMSVGKNTDDVAKRIEVIENTFGALPLYAIESRSGQVKLHPVDGVMPTLQSLKDRTYPFSKPLYALVRKDAHAGVHLFLTFIHSSKGMAVLEKHGYVPESSGKK